MRERPKYQPLTETVAVLESPDCVEERVVEMPPRSPVQAEPPVLVPRGLYAVATHARYLQPTKRDVAHLGPILPACPVCGALQYWHNHATDVWECWGCVPPRLRS